MPATQQALTDEFTVWEDDEEQSLASSVHASPVSTSGRDADAGQQGQQRSQRQLGATDAGDGYDKENFCPPPGTIPGCQARRALHLNLPIASVSAAATPALQSGYAGGNGKAPQPWLENGERAPFQDLTQRFYVQQNPAPVVKKQTKGKKDLAESLAALSLKDTVCASSKQKAEGVPRPVTKVGGLYRFSMQDAVRSIR